MPAAGEDLGDHELDEPGQLERQLLAALGQVVRVVADAALDGHPAVVGQDVEAGLEEVVVALEAEVLERLDRHDPVDRAVELLPALQPHVERARRCRSCSAAGRSRPAGSCDSVRPMTLTSYFSIARCSVRPQPQPISSSVMPGLRSSRSRLLVDVGDLRLRQRDVGAGEVRAAVLAGRVLEHPEEVVRQVVVGLDVLEMRRHVLRAG